MKNKFNEDDKKKVIDFLNVIAKKAKFELDTSEVIKYYGLLSYMQQELLPKIDANVMEILKVTEPEAKPEAKKASKAKTKK